MIDQLEALVELIQTAQAVAKEDGPGHDRLRAALRSVQEEQDTSAQLGAYEAVLQAVLSLCDGTEASTQTVARIRTLVRDALFVAGDDDEQPARGAC